MTLCDMCVGFAWGNGIQNVGPYVGLSTDTGAENSPGTALINVCMYVCMYVCRIYRDGHGDRTQC